MCPFEVTIEVSGKIKFIQPGGGPFVSITSNPGQKALITNTGDPSKQVAVNITGPSHESVDSNGDSTVKATGNTLILGLADVNGPFLLHTQGQVTLVNGIYEPGTGNGNVTDLCALIA